MNTIFTVLAWLLLLAMAGIIVWGTVGDGSLKWMTGEARRYKHGRKRQ